MFPPFRWSLIRSPLYCSNLSDISITFHAQENGLIRYLNLIFLLRDGWHHRLYLFWRLHFRRLMERWHVPNVRKHPAFRTTPSRSQPSQGQRPALCRPVDHYNIRSRHLRNSESSWLTITVRKIYKIITQWTILTTDNAMKE